MQAACFGCDVVIEGEDAATVADRFIAHATANHDWTYPEQALRNYARNTAEAPGRVSGGTERLDTIGEIIVHPVTDERIDDWLDLFDHRAFADNPDWASCYCLTPHRPQEEEPYWRDARERMTERLRDGSTRGYLAYVDGVAVGWVNASLRSEYRQKAYLLAETDVPDPAAVIGVSCFVIAPPYRRHGVAAALLDRVIADAPARGAAWIDGYPINDPEQAEESHHFRGPRAMFDNRGFAPVVVRERDTVVRRRVG